MADCTAARSQQPVTQLSRASTLFLNSRGSERLSADHRDSKRHEGATIGVVLARSQTGVRSRRDLTPVFCAESACPQEVL